jgi:hypothetical protein
MVSIELSFWEILIRMLLLGIAVGGLGVGAVGIYFGSKGTRRIGKILLIVGAIFLVAIIFPWPIEFNGNEHELVYTGEWAWDNIQVELGNLVVMLIASGIGGGIGVGLISIPLLLKALK